MSEVREVMCRSILSESKISDLTLNPYKGCSNGCKYCYVRFMMRRDQPRPHRLPTITPKKRYRCQTVLICDISK